MPENNIVEKLEEIFLQDDQGGETCCNFTC